MQYRLCHYQGQLVNKMLEHDAHVRTFTRHSIQQENQRRRVLQLYRICEQHRKRQSGIYTQIDLSFDQPLN